MKHKMRTILLAAVLLTAGISSVSAGVTATDSSAEQMSKLQALEQKIAKLESDQENNIAQLQNELQTERQKRSELFERIKSLETEVQDLRSEVQAGNQRQNETGESIRSLQAENRAQIVKMKLLEHTMEGLKLRQENTAMEYDSVKSELIKFFNAASSAKQKKVEQQKEHSASSSADEVAAAQEKIDPKTDDSKSESTGLSVSLQLNSPGGVTYIRWGRTTCEADASVLYSGYAAGKRMESNIWVGSEYLCLHSSPQWGDIVSAWSGLSVVVGVQYNFAGAPFSTENVAGQSFLGNDMPCTVCHVDERSHQVMIPGRMTCPTGWTLEYSGYLVSSAYNVHANPYMCLDRAPEDVPGGVANVANSQYVYPVESDCVALYCPPYTRGYEISCVVCSK